MGRSGAEEPGGDQSCPACGKSIVPQDRFCSGCGTRLQIFCWSCGSAVPIAARICAACGAEKPPAAESPLLDEAQAEPVPASVAAESPPAKEEAEQFGERRVATIAMSDLSGYTAMSERIDPETIEILMATIKSRAHEIVSEFGGTLNQFIGDEIVALYGVPIAHGRDACDAVGATLKLHAMVAEVASAHATLGEFDLNLHSGVASGLVLVNQRDVRDGVYTITGDTINTAARLVAVAGPNEIIVSPKTRAAILDEFDVVELEPVRLRGKNKPVVPFRVAGPSSGHEKHERRRGSATPFANRVTEMTELAEIVAHAESGLRIAVISGEGGIGKSRLIHEFLASPAPSVCTVLASHTNKIGTRIPYFPWIHCLRAGFGIAETATPQEAANIVISRCEVSSQLRGHTGALLHLMSLQNAADTDNTQETAGANSQRELWDAVLAFLRDICAARTSLLVFDDWHFADDVSKALLDEVVRELSSSPLAVVLCATEPMAIPGSVQIELLDLELEATVSMLAALFNVEHVAPELANVVFERTDGNPLFIEETALAMIEEGSITVGALARLAIPADQLALPENIQVAMLHRIDRLSPEDRECIRYAAVIGREFNASVLQRTLPEVNVADSIRRLCTLGILIPMSESASRFRFTHGIMQEVAYETLLHRARKKLHALVGSVIEQLYRDSLGDRYEELAFHYGRSADAERAIHYSECAGDKAADRYALADARRQYQDAYERLQAPETAAQPDEEHAGRLAIKWAQASVFAPTQAQLTALERSLTAAEGRGDANAVMEIEYWIGRLFYVFGHFNDAIARFERVAKLAGESGNQDLEARAVAVMGRALLFLAEPKRGEETLYRGISLLRPFQEPHETAYSMSSLACIKALMGEFTVAEEQYARALRLARSHNNASIESLVLQQLGWGRALRGDWQGAREICERCVVLADRTGNEVLRAFADIESAYTISFDGDPLDAHARVTVGLDRYVRTGARLAASVMHGWAAEVLARAFDFDGALVAVQTALDRETDGDRFGRIAAQRAIMLERTAAGDIAAVRSTFNKIDEFAAQFALHSDRARATLTFAEALRELHEPDADEFFELAHQRFFTLDMPWFALFAASKTRREANL